MPRTKAFDMDNAPEESLPYMEQGAKQSGGNLVNFFKQMAASPKALAGYMDLSGTLQGGALDRQTQESIAVGVSDFHGCKY